MSAYRDAPIVRLRYELELDEIARMGRAASVQVIAERAGAVVAVAIALVAVDLFAKVPWLVALLGTLAVGAGIGWLFRKWVVSGAGHSQLASLWKGRRQLEVEVTEDGITFVDPLATSRSAWEVVLFWRETEDGLLLYTSPRGCQLIPIRAFADEGARTTLMQILAEHVRRGDRGDVARASVVSWAPVAVYFGYLTIVLGALAEGLGGLFG